MSIASTSAAVLWHLPGRFRIVNLAGPSYSLRCLVFHNVSPKQSPFTSGMGVTCTPEDFESTLKFLTTHYTPVDLDMVLSSGGGRELPKRPVLVTFDDAYASVVQYAAPICKRYGVPAVFFVNAGFVGNERLAPDNLICYVANISGLETVNAAVHAVPGYADRTFQSLGEVFEVFLPGLTLSKREVFLDALKDQSGLREPKIAMDAQLYLTDKHLSGLKAFGFEVGNHTYSHAYCRVLSKEEIDSEVARNKAELEARSGTKIRAFSPPYGRSHDVTPELDAHLRATGHKAIFLSESVANLRKANSFRFDRINPRAASEKQLFLEMELLPRLRVQRNWLVGHREVRSVQ